MNYDWDVALWQFLDLGLDARYEDGFQWGIFLGISTMLNARAAGCRPVESRDCPPGRISTAHAGISVGHAFDL